MRPPSPAQPGDVAALLRALPRMDDLLAALGDADRARAPREEWAGALGRALGEIRAEIRAGRIGPVVLASRIAPERVHAAARRTIQRRRDPGCVRVVNATGVVLHTNLGRAPLPPAAIAALVDAGVGYQLLAADIENGARAPRERHVERLLVELTGAEAATAVNNNAAATLLALAAFGRGREVIVARGQLVEIGGSYRIPDVLAQSGSVLREVGSTNRVHLSDYELAIGPRTSAVLRAHTSNYRVEGFHDDVPLTDLVALAHAYNLPVIHDLGSGALVSLKGRGVPGDEPLIADSLAAGVDLVTASGDKLIGGPQMGLLMGTREAVARARSHPLFRAMRCDKLTLIAMEATLRSFLHPERLALEHPVYAMLGASDDELEQRAYALAMRLAGEARSHGWPLHVDEASGPDAVGAGSLPTVELPGHVVRLRRSDEEAGAFARRLRRAPTPVFTTVEDGHVLVHVRTLLPGEEDAIVAAVESAFDPVGESADAS